MSGENELFLKHRVIIEQTWENVKIPMSKCLKKLESLQLKVNHLF